jgi:hypothetical protein
MRFPLDDPDVSIGHMAGAVRVAAEAVEEPGGDVEAVARTQSLGH